MVASNSYATEDEVKLAAGFQDGADDQKISIALEAASREIDGYTKRRFYIDSTASARVQYVGADFRTIRLDDFSTTSGLIVQVGTGFNGSYEQTVSSSYYQVFPLNGIRDGIPWAYTEILLTDNIVAPTTTLHPSAQVTAKWGWPSVPLPVKQACIMQTLRIYRALAAPLGVIETPDIGAVRMPAMNPEVRELLRPYVKKGPVLVG